MTTLFGPDTQDAPEREPGVYVIPEWNLQGLADKIAKLAKRAAKLGVPAPRLDAISTETRYRIQRDPLLVPVEGEFSAWVNEAEAQKFRNSEQTVIQVTGATADFHTVRVTGEFPKYAGWSLRAVIDRDLEEQDQPNVVHVVGDAHADPAWRTLGDYCDHCKAKDGRVVPRGRKKLVVVEHPSSEPPYPVAPEQKIVGLTCLRDFLGGTSPEQIASWAEVIGGLDDLAGSYEDYEGPRGPHYEERFAPEDFLALTSAVIRKDGWLSRTKAREELFSGAATADTVWGYLARTLSRAEMEERPDTTGDDYKAADAALEWAIDIPLDTDNDYLANVRAIAGKQGWRFRDAGIGASILRAHQNEVAHEERRKAEQAERKPAPTGRVMVRGKVIKTDWRETQWGTSLKITIAADDGYRVWTSAGKALESAHGDTEVQVGDRVEMQITLEPSPDDETFAFGRRPSGGKVIE